MSKNISLIILHSKSFERSGKLFFEIIKLKIFKYFIASSLSMGIDFSISYFLYKQLNINYLISNNVGIVSGLIFHYFISIKFVFKNNRNKNTFEIYIATFLLGLILANGTIWVSYDLANLTLLLSKFLSVAVPFFITYFIRKKLLERKIKTIREVKNEDLL